MRHPRPLIQRRRPRSPLEIGIAFGSVSVFESETIIAQSSGQRTPPFAVKRQKVLGLSDAKWDYRTGKKEAVIIIALPQVRWVKGPVTCLETWISGNLSTFPWILFVYGKFRAEHILFRPKKNCPYKRDGHASGLYPSKADSDFDQTKVVQGYPLNRPTFHKANPLSVKPSANRPLICEKVEPP